MKIEVKSASGESLFYSTFPASEFGAVLAAAQRVQSTAIMKMVLDSKDEAVDSTVTTHIEKDKGDVIVLRQGPPVPAPR